MVENFDQTFIVEKLIAGLTKTSIQFECPPADDEEEFDRESEDWRKMMEAQQKNLKEQISMQNTKLSKTTIEEVKTELEQAFPEYTFSIGKRLFSKCVIAKNTKYSGADIFVKDGKIVILAALPEMKTRILFGSGVLLLKFFSKKFSEPSLKIYAYLSRKFNNVQLRK